MSTAPLELVSRYSLAHITEAVSDVEDMELAAEWKLRKLWPDILFVREDDLGSHDDFFVLLAIQLSAVAQTRKIELSVPDI